VFSPDDRTLAGMNGDGLHLYDVASGKRRAHRPFRPVRDRPFLAFHPDGRRLAVGVGKRLTILNLQTMNEVAEVRAAKKPFRGGAFTPDGRLLLTAGNEEAVQVWETTTWKQTAGYDWDVGAVLCVAVAPHGMTAAAAGKGGPVVVWDLDY
jgi:WD40 repeat protein